MKVIYNTNTKKVIAVGDALVSENEDSVELSESNITRPISGTVVDDVNNPTETVNKLLLIKKNKKESIKNKAYSLLEQYDWYVIRKQEEGIAIPDTITTYRSDVRSTEDTATEKVENATTVEEVKSININWPSKPDV